MCETVEKQETSAKNKLMKKEEETNRDKVKEKFDELRRKKDLESRAAAITKFETSFKSMFSRTLKTVVVNILADVKEPIFDKTFQAYLE